ncbi:MAG: hypothetical protein ABSD48_07475 [Armatimonadota bacterium]|jgi:hypothetical protein
MSVLLNRENTTSFSGLEILKTTVEYYRQQVVLGGESLGAPGSQPISSEKGLVGRARQSIARNWEALRELADH